MGTLDDPLFQVRGMVIGTILAVSALVAGCAVETTPSIGRSASACGTNAVLYCERAPHGDRCECFRHSEVRDMMRSLSAR